jgi:holin-like protein
LLAGGTADLPAILPACLPRRVDGTQALAEVQASSARRTTRRRERRGKRMMMLRGVTLFLLLQAIGEALTRALGLPVPGPVLGMILLFGALSWSAVREPVAAAADALLSHLSLLFVPVGVGVITHMAVVLEHGAGLLWVLVLSTWIGIAVTALVLRLLMRGGRGDG